MAWNSNFKLGLLGGELDFPCQVMDIDPQEDNVELSQRNLSGAALKGYLRQNVPTVTITFAMLSDALLSILRGFQASNAALNFIYNTSMALKYLMATSATTTSVVIPLTSATGVVITGVFLQSDSAQSGTNYYSGGSSFVAATGTITLASALPGANTAVWVNYTYTGISCWAKVSPKPHQGVYKNYWQGTLTLTGA